jgi:hypothetical protein
MACSGTAACFIHTQTVGRRALPLPFPSFFPSYCDVSEARSYFASTIPGVFLHLESIYSESFSIWLVYRLVAVSEEFWTAWRLRPAGRSIWLHQSLLSTPDILVCHCPFNDSSRRDGGGRPIARTSQIDSKVDGFAVSDIRLLCVNTNS